MAKTRVLFIGGDNFAALAFQEKYNGSLISDVIPKLDFENGENIANYDESVVRNTIENYVITL